MKKIYGVGYNSGRRGGFPAKTSEGITKEYDQWRRLLCRCYSEAWRRQHPTYEECFVDAGWHDFQNYAEWATSYKFYRTDWDLDKDLIVVNNKCYSPETCVFLPQVINKAIVIRGGVSRGRHRFGKFFYETSCNGEWIGQSENPLTFSNEWVKRKLRHIHLLAEAYKNELDPVAYTSLLGIQIAVNDIDGLVRRIS